jgi:hypothetical protein
VAELKIKYHYEKGIADTGKLELYDAAIALKGISRASAIITHAFLNGETRTYGGAAKGAKFYIYTPKRGSFVYEAAIFFAGSVSSGLFYDFVKYGYNEAVGKHDDEAYTSALDKRIEPTIGELPVVLESALDEIHRPIKQDDEIQLTIARPRGEILAVFDSDTAQYLLPSTNPAPHPISGNVTKFNSLTGWGKFFDLIEARTVSFKLNLNSIERQKSFITWSLHETNLGRKGLLYLRANAVIAPSGKIKRYLIMDVSNTPLS